MSLKENLKRCWGLFFAAAVVCIILWLPTPEGLSLAGQKALALFVGIIILWGTEPLPLPIISLIMVPIVVFFQLTTVGKALNSFSTTSIFLIVGALLMAPAMSKTGFAERFIYWLLSKIGCTAKRITLGVTVANIALAFMVPSSAARTAILLPVCVAVIEIFRKNNKQEGRSNFAVALLLTLAFTNATISAGILTATIPNPVTVDFIYKASGHMISYVDWFIYGFPPALIMTMFTWWFIGKVFRSEMDEIPGGQEFIVDKLKGMGKISQDEWKTGFVFLLVVLLWMTSGYTKIDTTIVALIGVCLLFILQVINWADAAKTSAFQFLLVMGGGFVIGDLLLSTGAAKWAATSLFGILNLSGASTLVILIVVMLIVQYLHIPFMGTTKMATMMMPMIISFAMAAGLDPVVLAMPAGMLIAGYPLFLFYNTIPSLLVYGTNELKMSDFPKIGVPVCTLAVVLYAVLAMTYWRWLGLF